MNLASLLRRTALSAPDARALAQGTTTFATYSQLDRRAGALAGALQRKLGLQRGDRVVLFQRNCPQYVEALYACWIAGCVAVPVNNRLNDADLAHILSDSQPRLILMSADLAETATAAARSSATTVALIAVGSAEYEKLCTGDGTAIAAVTPDHPAWLFYTSGTTGRPKGATLTHRNLLAMTMAYFTDVDAIAHGDAILHAAPMSHGSGLYILPHISAGACHVVPESDRFDTDEIFALLTAHRGVGMFAAPTMVNRLVAAGDGGRATGLKTIIYGGGPMYLEDCKRAMACFGPRLAQIYGQGETPMTITVLSKHEHEAALRDGDDERLSSVGRRHTPVDVRLGDEEDGMGEILVRGDTVMAGYWNNPDATAQAVRDGWLQTGDIGSFSADGYLTLRDRSKDLIISGGSNIYPREIEEALLRHADVAEVAIVGQADREWGEVPVAFVVRRAGTQVDAAALDTFCTREISRYKRPKAYRFVETLPKNAYGKVLKRELRQTIVGERP